MPPPDFRFEVLLGRLHIPRMEEEEEEEDAVVGSADAAVALIHNWVCRDMDPIVGFDCINAQDSVADDNSLVAVAVDNDVLANAVAADDSTRSFAENFYRGL